jgi:hypothetical protein
MLGQIKKHLPGKKYIAGTDTFIRHRSVAALLEGFNPATVIDYGGEGFLNNFVGCARVTTANVKESANILCIDDSLPFDDDSFDVSVCIDTLEHLPRENRLKLLKELMRVARRAIVVCAPLGPGERMCYEERLLASGMLWGEMQSYLAEHVKYGLPTPNEVRELREILSANVFYQGDFRRVRRVRKAFAYSLLALQILGNMLLDISWGWSNKFQDRYNPYTNRFFLVVKKHPMIVKSRIESS